MRNALTQENPETYDFIASLNQPTMPSSFKKLASMTSAANHVSVSHAPCSFLISSHVRTCVKSRTAKPINAVVVASIFRFPPKIHKKGRAKRPRPSRVPIFERAHFFQLLCCDFRRIRCFFHLRRIQFINDKRGDDQADKSRDDGRHSPACPGQIHTCHIMGKFGNQRVCRHSR